MNFRPPAVPLVTVDPYFSIWSFADCLYDDTTRNWTGRANPMFAGVLIGEQWYTLMGTEHPDHHYYRVRGKVLPQTKRKVTPLCTFYEFENELLRVTLAFRTPLLLDRLDILSRPVSYMEYHMEAKKEEAETARFVFAISSECCADNWDQNVAFKKTALSLSCGNSIQNVLSKSGDDVGIDWGYLHLAERSALPVDLKKMIQKKSVQQAALDVQKTYRAFSEKPYMAVEKEEKDGVIVIAYDEVCGIEYYGKAQNEYYRTFFDSFSDMLTAAVLEYPAIRNMCDAFDAELTAEAEKYGEKYTDLICLAYRQAIAAHKLAADESGEILFISKECFSNGCAATLDVTYPSIPLFLKYNPELVLGMLRPIFKQVYDGFWPHPYAPHDAGRYPLVDGNVYGDSKERDQMPVEECGNMLLCVAAAAKYAGSDGFAKQHQKILKQWADYLVEFGYDPGDQLCTDDFAGHLAHNCNLSIKAILGIAAYGKLFGDQKYQDIAAEYAKKWEKDAKAEQGSRLTFDRPDSWGLKYNLVWDRLLDLHIFNPKIAEEEVALYQSKMQPYGVPLDIRNDYTKTDWEMWTTVLTENTEYFETIVDAIHRMLCDTPDRVPFTDWYYSSDGRFRGFQNRTVLGGIFINLI